ncbi:23S rRNA (adenine(2503)-C(2))-methyltransferase RlmN [Opitutia bacterium ISCC 51]|nr:23S rRNA (adenine(2503)-C(2))-methyltransferase RlmN [Opitutae bacterium ISCC 51]QXD26961.1 23S rRNA (adenine(2503)-C(2))-methyltransferase RlmN [Opitutae bacterium ISCC 52]
MKYEPNQELIYGQTLEELEAFAKESGQPKFRAKQLTEWLYKKRVQSWEEMSNLPAKWREQLEEQFILSPATPLFNQQSQDVTNKVLMKLGDDTMIETVLIRAPMEGVGQKSSRTTVCISTQVGCAYGCKFCASGLMGWRRDLLAGEIVAQLMQVCQIEDGRTERAKPEIPSFDNIVIMGMGEPLANYDHLMKALRIVNADWGLKFGARRITVSTSGLVPQIKKLAEEPIQFRLAISLHGATNHVRTKIMPVNRKYPLEELVPAAKTFAKTHGRMLTLEYILIQEVNDSLDQATALVEIARQLHAHVNLIPYNRVEGLDWKRPGHMRQNRFGDILKKAKVSYTIRREKGHDIDAACGQLRLKEETPENLDGERLFEN